MSYFGWKFTTSLTGFLLSSECKVTATEAGDHAKPIEPGAWRAQYNVPNLRCQSGHHCAMMGYKQEAQHVLGGRGFLFVSHSRPMGLNVLGYQSHLL